MRERILFVDDEQLLLGSYELYLSDKYNVVTVTSAKKALDLLVNDSNFAVVISDFNMSGMNGVEFLNIVKGLYPNIIRILMTAVNDVKVVLDAVNESNIFRFLVKDEDLGKLDHAIEDAISLKNILRREKTLQDELKLAYDRLEQDLKSAAKLQQSIQPKPMSFSGYSFNSLYLPSKFLSGDNFNYFQVDDWIVFYVLDVTGHGIPASMLSFAISRMINSDKIPVNPVLNNLDGKYTARSPGEVLQELNKIFMTKDQDTQFFSLSYGVIYLNDYKFLISNAANRQPILIRNEEIEVFNLKGLPLGFMPESKYSEVEHDIKKGDKIILYSDGVIELNNPDGEMFGENRFYEFLRNNSKQDSSTLLNSLKSEINSWSGIDDYNDDITVLCIEKN